MKTVKRIPVTREGFEKLKKELESLKNERPQAVKTLAEARSMGDLSENGLYTAAKARLRSLDNQIFRVEIQIKLADIIEGQKGQVSIGSKVVVMQENVKREYNIVGDFEANPRDGKISQHSPLGNALIGKKSGEEAYFFTPNGKTVIKVLEIH